MQSDLARAPVRSVQAASGLRWVIPLLIALIAAGFTVLEELSLAVNRQATPYLILAAFLFTLIGAAFAWFMLTWILDVVRETRYRYEAMVALHDTSLDITAQLDTPKLLEALLRRGAHLLSANICSLFLYDPATRVIRNVANYNSWRNWIGNTLRPGQGAIGQVILTGQPLIVNNYETWDKREIMDSLGPTMVMCVPLRWQEQIIGGIGVVSERGARPFTEKDLWLLSLFADLASIALNNAELHTRVKQFSEELEEKVEARTSELSEAKEEVALHSEQLRRLLSKTVQAQEDERRRIARDMHDGVVQLITAVRYELRAMQVVAGVEIKPAVQEKMLAARELLDEMEREIRHAIYDLHPPSLDAGGLSPTLQSYIKRFQAVSGLECHLNVTGTPVRQPLQSESSTYRLIEEALANVATHSEATTLSVLLQYEASTLTIIIEDNGCGFDVQAWQQNAHQARSHLGLLSMQERTAALGGSMDIESAPGCGTRLIFRLPVPNGGH